MAIERFITLQTAARLISIPETILIELVSKGRIKAIILETGEMAVSETELMGLAKKEDRADYQELASLAGQGIHISDAARKYGIPQQTISRWVARKWIAVLSHQGRKTIIDERDIAWYARYYKEVHGGQGKWVFTPNGIPYQKKH